MGHVLIERAQRTGRLFPWLAAAVWFALLALGVAGPLLGGGHVLLLDFPSGPRFGSSVPILPLPSSGDLGSGLPLAALHSLLRAVHPLLPDKVFLLAPILVGGVGVYRFARSRLGVGPLAATFGATLFVVNPFVRDRYLAGHLYFLLGYALLPWALAPLADALQGASPRAGPLAGLWLAALAAVDVHVAGFYGLLVLAAIAAAPRSRLVLAGAALGLATGLSAYWLLPAAFFTPGAAIGSADLGVYATRPSGIAVLPALLSMHGFWRDEFPSLAQRAPALYFLLVPILGLAVVGVDRMLSTEERRRLGVTLSVTAVLGLLLAAGTSFPPTAGVFRWLFGHIPLFGIYREPQKFLALVILAYAIFGTAGVAAVQPGRGRSRIVPALALGAVLAYGGGMFWGFGATVRPARYPDGWREAERVMEERGPGRLLVLPWHLYAVWSFSDGRIVANPATSFFSREVIAANEAGFTEVPPQSSDPFRRYVAAVLEQRRKVKSFGHLMAPLGVRYVAWMREADWEAYRFLERQEDLLLVYRGEGISLYENLAWGGPVLGLSAGEDLSSPAALPGSANEGAATRELLQAPPLAPQQNDPFPPLARALLHWRRIEPASSSAFVATGDRCTDGWRLGDQVPRCHLGAVATFPAPDRPAVLWRPLAGARITGLGVSVLTLVGTGLYLRRVSRARKPADA